MSKVIMLKGVAGNGYTYRKGAEIELADDLAKQFCERGLARPVPTRAHQTAEKAVAKAAPEKRSTAKTTSKTKKK